MLAEQAIAENDLRGAKAQWSIKLIALLDCYPASVSHLLDGPVVNQLIDQFISLLPPGFVEKHMKTGRTFSLWQAAADLLEELSRLGWGS